MNTGAVELGALGPGNQTTGHIPERMGTWTKSQAGLALGRVPSALTEASLSRHHNAHGKGFLRMRSLRLRTTGTHAGSPLADSLHQDLLLTGPSSASAPASGHHLFLPNTRRSFARMSQRQVGTRGWWGSAESRDGVTHSKFCQKVEPWRSPSPSLGVRWRLEVSAVLYLFCSAGSLGSNWLGLNSRSSCNSEIQVCHSPRSSIPKRETDRRSNSAHLRGPSQGLNGWGKDDAEPRV